jgi:hypothetical protein
MVVTTSRKLLRFFTLIYVKTFYLQLHIHANFFFMFTLYFFRRKNPIQIRFNQADLTS